jgi:hypothetical protein
MKNASDSGNVESNLITWIVLLLCVLACLLVFAVSQRSLDVTPVYQAF